ncbi:hypothetical protein P8C59_007209 [Phyllachora maydis]|uniref:RED-like N-terminal domain-containing protein n=1 Tax=Phyllachora maydis TaxID=1825666 RepID=A0AAD9I927_9PEZI|nr:hypothetical protein P8C59_007209 [Phyllachora maydis]
MNNEQFRRLVVNDSAKHSSLKNGASSSTDGGATGRPAGSGTPSLLGSRMKSSIPMTPRSVAGVGKSDFARQLAERNQALNGSKAKNSKHRSAVPKGSKLAQGYVDRARTRLEEEEDERAERLKALAKALKDGEMDRETYDRLRGEIAGGDLSSTHLVKGLDFKLLERVRRGEDVYGEKSTHADTESAQDGQGVEPRVDVDDELERLEAAEVQAVAKEKTQKKGQFATTGLNPGQKRSRNQILAELKAAREAARAKEESALGSKFKKIGAKKEPGTRIEVDSKGREVMIIVDEDGHERRKIRRLDRRAAREMAREKEAFVPDQNAEVLGMEVPEMYRKQQEQEKDDVDDDDVNIFDDAGSDYDPLADLEDDSDKEAELDPKVSSDDKEAPAEAVPPPPRPKAKPVDYFKDSKTGLVSEESYKSSVDEPTFLAALRKAKALGAAEKSEEEQKEAEREERLKKMLQSRSRDDDDLDLGFGGSRMEDEADLEDQKIKLSAWGADPGGDDKGHGGGESKRKRGAKKRKGDKNSFADVMKVMERQKGGGG